MEGRALDAPWVIHPPPAPPRRQLPKIALREGGDPPHHLPPPRLTGGRPGWRPRAAVPHTPIPGAAGTGTRSGETPRFGCHVSECHPCPCTPCCEPGHAQPRPSAPQRRGATGAPHDPDGGFGAAARRIPRKIPPDPAAAGGGSLHQRGQCRGHDAADGCVPCWLRRPARAAADGPVPSGERRRSQHSRQIREDGAHARLCRARRPGRGRHPPGSRRRP